MARKLCSPRVRSVAGGPRAALCAPRTCRQLLRDRFQSRARVERADLELHADAVDDFRPDTGVGLGRQLRGDRQQPRLGLGCPGGELERLGVHREPGGGRRIRGKLRPPDRQRRAGVRCAGLELDPFPERTGLSSIQGSAGNFAALGSGEVWVWSHVSGAWTQISVPGLVEVVSSAGNFAARDSTTVRAWSQLDGSVTASPSIGGLSQLLGSERQLRARNAGGAWAWDRNTRAWSTSPPLSGLIELVGAGGNFAARVATKAYAWNQVTAVWTASPTFSSGAIQELIGSEGNFALRLTDRVYTWAQQSSTLDVRPAVRRRGAAGSHRLRGQLRRGDHEQGRRLESRDGCLDREQSGCGGRDPRGRRGRKATSLFASTTASTPGRSRPRRGWPALCTALERWSV